MVYLNQEENMGKKENFPGTYVVSFPSRMTASSFWGEDVRS